VLAIDPMPPLPEHWGWYTPTPELAADFERQLAVEIGPGHPLVGRAVKIVGYRRGTDDILCRHESEPSRFTVVHLSWMSTEPAPFSERVPHHPTVEADGSFDDFLAYEAKYHNPPA